MVAFHFIVYCIFSPLFKHQLSFQWHDCAKKRMHTQYTHKVDNGTQQYDRPLTRVRRYAQAGADILSLISARASPKLVRPRLDNPSFGLLKFPWGALQGAQKHYGALQGAVILVLFIQGPPGSI